MKLDKSNKFLIHKIKSYKHNKFYKSNNKTYQINSNSKTNSKINMKINKDGLVIIVNYNKKVEILKCLMKIIIKKKKMSIQNKANKKLKYS